MRVISIRNKIKGISRRWNKHHETYGYHPDVGALKKHNEEICKRLAAIDPETATAAEVNAIIGDEKWTRREGCFECDRMFDAVIEIGEEPDGYRSSTAQICLGCLEEAVAALHKEEASGE